MSVETQKELQNREYDLQKREKVVDERQRKLDLIEEDLKETAKNIDARAKKADKLFDLKASQDDLQDFFTAVTTLYYKWCAENEGGQEQFIKAMTHALELRKLLNRQ